MKNLPTQEQPNTQAQPQIRSRQQARQEQQMPLQQPQARQAQRARQARQAQQEQQMPLQQPQARQEQRARQARQAQQEQQIPLQQPRAQQQQQPQRSQPAQAQPQIPARLPGTTHKRAMSLVEVMIGALILALAVIPSMTVIFRDTRTVTATRDHLSAALWAQKLLEIARNYRFELLNEDGSSTPEKTFEWALKNDAAQLNKETINNIEYSVVNAKVDPVPNRNDSSQAPTMMLVSFGVAYNGADGRPHLLNVSTAIFQE